MTLGFKIQEWIHKIEQGPLSRIVRWVALGATFLGLAVLYDALCFRNLPTAEAMNAAQLARNIGEGQGFTTKSITPFSMYLVSRHRPDKSALLKSGHPDLVTAPLYPVLLAPIIKAVPAQDMTAVRNFSVARHDLAITIFNQLLLLLAAALVFWLARKWFDRIVATLSVILFVATELYWRFSVSGLSTNLLLVLALLLVWVLTAIEERARATPAGSAGSVVLLSIVLGLLLAAMTLTRYACGFLVIPVCLFAALFLQQRRATVMLVVLAVFTLAVAPWVARNLHVSGTPFGVAGYAAMEQTRVFPEDRLQHSLHPELFVPMPEYLRKLVVNARDVLMTDLPRISGNWLSAFFLVGMLVRFRSLTLSRLRWFVLLSLAVLIPVQALGKTQLWADSPDVNTENLLVLFSPLVLIFGVAVFFVLLDAFQFSRVQRWAACSAFGGVIAAPLLLALLPPHPSPIVYPPYFPPGIQLIGRWMDPPSLTMTDIPAGFSWYANRQAMLTTEFWRGDFAEIHDYQKPVNCLYLTPKTTEHKALGNWMRGDTNGWEGFIVDLLVRQEVPTGFPLRRGVQGYLGEGQLLLMDYDRWRRTPAAQQ